MKEEKLFKIVNNVDDDLICEMLDYSPDVKEKGGEYEGVLYHAPEKVKKVHYWQYPVAAAALMLVLVGGLFIFNANNDLPYNDGDEQNTTSNTDNSMVEITTTDDPYTPVDTNIPYEFTEEDKELQKFLAETVEEAEKFQSLYDNGFFGDIGWQKDWDSENDGIIIARFPQLEEAVDKQISYQYILLSDELPFKTADELEAELSLYYSSKIVSAFMGHVAVGEITERTEEYCLIEFKDVTLDENGFLFSVPGFVEINGRLYKAPGGKGGWFTPNWSMAKVISKTDDELIFSYLGYGMGDIKEILAGLGRLKYEDGWKYDWWDIPSPYEMVDIYEVWDVPSPVKVSLSGDYDKSKLVDFDYSEVLKETKSHYEGVGDFLDKEYDEFRDIYQKAYALASILSSEHDDFLNTLGYGTSGGKSWSDAVQIRVTDERSPSENRTYYLTGYSWDSFYNEMLSIFTEDEADKLIFDNKLFYSYDGALWYAPDSTGADDTSVHDEYYAHLYEDEYIFNYVFSIVRTSYHVRPGAPQKFDPEKIDLYEAKVAYFTFINTENGWRASDFDYVNQ